MDAVPTAQSNQSGISKAQVVLALTLVAIQGVMSWQAIEFEPLTNWPMYSHIGVAARGVDRVRVLAVSDAGATIDISRLFYERQLALRNDPLSWTGDTPEARAKREQFAAAVEDFRPSWFADVRIRSITFRLEKWVYDFPAARLHRLTQKEWRHERQL